MDGGDGEDRGLTGGARNCCLKPMDESPVSPPAPEGLTTKERLLEAAEELFAREGFERVSVRAITARAGANVAAVNYHFGSRRGLVHAVVERHVEPGVRERLERLGELERRGGGTVEELAEAFIRPFVAQVRRSELAERLFGKLIGRMFGDDDGEVISEAMVGRLADVMERYRRAFSRVVPGLGEDEVRWRMTLMAGAMVHAFGGVKMRQRLLGKRHGEGGIEEVLARCVRFVAAGMRQGVVAEGAAKGAAKAAPEGASEGASEGAAEGVAKRAGQQGEFVF